ncbi:hypothetical protein VIOR3934_00245 [Vibrio orientalis CIP 102891 = ATCC 33934]|uniref:Uncharacterized protein n=2 Tax=Vibrio orientalis TaxID=28175 RepID=C9QGI3_VIBOR|nr:hypothetical protein VIA_000929 [Vibrio orientalis CIP 102891 = ATCC 33934]EGU50780.1 hypothetical protein VIOR3934_00245 [Vibrio orientalis CIP 102891 = ATCC 33934]
MVWEFDAMTSAYMLDGEDLSKPETLKNLAHDVINNMLNHHYFTYFYQGDQPIKYRVAVDPVMTFKRGKITLNFDLPLSKPIPANTENLKLLIFDPSYFVDMSWITTHSIGFHGGLDCELELLKPNPTPAQMAYAMALPIDADPDDQLGQLFTETLYFECTTDE